MGTRMVVIRYDSLKFADNKIVLPGGTKDGLTMLPAFEYSKERLSAVPGAILKDLEALEARTDWTALKEIGSTLREK